MIQPKPHWRKEFPALFDSGSANPLADAALAVLLPKRRDSDLFACDSANSRSLPAVAAALGRARNSPGVVHLHGMPWGFVYANCGRKPLPMPKDPLATRFYLEAELGAAALRDAVDRGEGDEFLGEMKAYDLAVSVAERGGSPVRTVVVHSAKDGDHELLVLPGYWSVKRVAAFACRRLPIRDCAFCGDDCRRLDTFLPIDCGGVLRVLPACDACERQISNDAMGRGFYPDWICTWDDWDTVTGYPSDEHR